MKEGWTYKKLGEVCRIERGGSPRPIKDYITNNRNGLNWIKIGDTDPQGKYIYSTKEKIKPEGLKKSRWVEEDEFLLSNSMSFGRPYILKTNGCIHDGWLVLRDYQKNLFIDFFYYMLLSSNVQKQFKSKAQGSTVSNLNTDRVASVNVSFPSIEEQQRIVSRLDLAFAHIDERKANAEKQLSEARALFQKALTKAMEPKEGWEEKNMKEIVVSLTDGDHQPPPKSNDGIPFITISNIDKDANRIDFENTFFVPRSYFEGLKKDRIPHEGDVLYTVTGSFGIPVLIDFQKEFCFQRHIALIRPNQNRLSSKFLYYWILSSYATTQAEDTATGTAQRTVSLNSLRNFVITIPPLSEQQRIVSRLDSLSAHVRELEEVLQKTIAECDALKQALLRKVFE